MNCKACGVDHDPLVRCDVAARMASAVEPDERVMRPANEKPVSDGKQKAVERIAKQQRRQAHKDAQARIEQARKAALAMWAKRRKAAA